MTFKEIDRIETVDVNRHAWIEASAGTGKTHTLSHLAVRLLKERADLDIGNILLVTFTEKAAGELKERVRQLIATTAGDLAHDDPSARRFFSMMTSFDDEAAIYTIHGFCHHLLKDYAFETGALFSSEMVADQSLAAPILKKEMLEAWPRRYGRYLPEMMRLAGIAGGKGGVEAKIGAILQKTPRPDRGDRLLPRIDQKYHDLRNRLMTTATQLDILLNGSPSFVEQYGQLHIRKNSKQANIKNILDPLARWSQAPDPVNLAAVTQYRKIKKEGADAITPVWLKAGDNSATACPTLLRVKEHLARLLALHEQMTHYLVAASIEPLQQRIQAAKARAGLFSYDDLIGQVYEALFSDHGLLFLEAIRDRFKVALVDEFQDTDPLQWRIFRKVFLQGPFQRLMLIGDPKQAIYGFRGADLYTYLAAKKELTRLAQKKKAVLYTLSINYRSSRRLIAAHNRIFGRLEWFGDSNQTGDGISYQKVRHDPYGKYDEEAGRAFHLIDVSLVERPAGAYAPLAQFIAREIRVLASQESMTVYPGESRPPRPIQWSDVAILIRRKKGPETVFIERALSDNAIPFSYYKKPGLFQSKEAYLLATVLQAVAAPHDRGAVRRAFLTPFFALSPDEAVDPQLGDIMEKARLHLTNWVTLARKRQWGALFEALLTNSGFTYRSAQKNLWERQITNYKQLIERLTIEALGSNLDLERLLVWFDQMRTQGYQSGKEEAVHRIETELPKVQIMTIHASKGLEFPIVFVVGGLTQGRAAALKTFHQMEGFESRRVIDLTGKGNPERVKKEQLDEEKNLYYVAMTRARQRLYFPFWKGRKRAGPVGGFIAAAIEKAFSRCNRDVAWRHPDETAATAPLPGVNETSLKPPTPVLPPQPLLPENRVYLNRVTQLASFTSLQQKRSSRGTAAHSFWWDLTFKEDDEPSQWVVPPMTTDELPGGKTMGSCLHLLLETIDYTHVVSDQESLAPGKPCGRVVDQAMAAFGIDPEWRAAVAGIVWSTLTTPLKVGDSQITLGALPQKDRLHETAFMFTTAEKEAIARTRGLRGAIDLVFRYRNRCYVVDFKSNRLADYGPESLAAGIAQDGYERQYRIYAAAIYRWLAQLHPGRPAQFELGGVFYLFLRGLTKKGSTGIYFVPPERLGRPEKIEKQVWLWSNREPVSDA